MSELYSDTKPLQIQGLEAIDILIKPKCSLSPNSYAIICN